MSTSKAVTVTNANEVSFRARLLARLMRQLRQDNGLTLKYVAVQVGVDLGSMRRFEHGGWAPSHDQIVALLDMYREHDPLLRGQLLRLARTVSPAEAEGVGPDESFADLLWLEAEATTIRHYATTSPLTLPRQAEQLDAAGRARQQMPQRSRPVRLELVVDECALHHPPADHRVWASTLDHLIHTAAPPTTRLQVLPADVARPPQAVGGFTVYTLATPLPPSVVHIEHAAGRLLLESSDHLSVFTRLQELALPYEDSTALITNVLKNTTLHNGKVN
jgi:transcriptional regulator with XRE-family HTH domain